MTICDGDSIYIGGNVYTLAGDYTDTLVTINGCDSIIITNINVIDLNIIQNDTVICFGDSITLNIDLSNIQQNYSINWTEIYLEDFEDGQAQGWYAGDGGWGGQGVTELNTVSEELMVKLRVCVLSQPNVLIYVLVYIPLFV